MSDYTSFESRNGIVKYSAVDIYNFASDIRNFEKFIPEGKVSNVSLSETTCSFDIPSIGHVSVSLDEKVEYSRVTYKGVAIQSTEFEIILDMIEDSACNSEVKVTIRAVINPMLKMMLSDPLKRFLDLLVTEIENFHGWK